MQKGAFSAIVVIAICCIASCGKKAVDAVPAGDVATNGAAPKDPSPPTHSNTDAAPAAEKPSPAPVAAPSGALFAQALDLDGDGTEERVTVGAQGIVVGEAKMSLDKTFSALVETEMKMANKELEVRIVDFNPSKPGQQVALVVDNGEDDRTWAVFTYKDKAIHSAGEVSGSNIRIADGVLQSHGGNCGVTHKRHWALRQNKLELIHDEKSGTHDPGKCAACPFVYAGREQGQMALQGEILRELRRQDLEQTQSLSLRRMSGCSERLWVRLAEEKPEVTHLDSVFIEVGGRKIAPETCLGGDKPYCSDDGTYLRLGQGEDLTLEFVLPEDKRCAVPTLIANGFYVPTGL